MEDSLNFCWQTEDDLNYLEIRILSHFVWQKEEDFNFSQFFIFQNPGKWKRTSILWQMEDDLNLLLVTSSLTIPSLT